MNKLSIFFSIFAFAILGAQTPIGDTIFFPQQQNESSFGANIEINSAGNIVAASAPAWNHPTYGENSGVVNVFQLNESNNTWETLGEPLEIQGTLAGYGIGLDMSDDGHTIVIGAPFYSEFAHPRIGFVQAFTYNDGSWQQKGQVFKGVQDSERMGGSLSMSSDGSIISMSARMHDSDIGADTGLLRVFQFNEATFTWEQLGSDFYGDNANDRLTFSKLTADGNRIIMGATNGLNPATEERTGYAKIFDWDGTSWVQVGSTIYGDLNLSEFGFAFDFTDSNSKIAISARRHDENKGMVKIYNYDGTDWVQEGEPILGISSQTNLGSPPIVGENLGSSLAFNDLGDILAVGCSSNSENTYREQGKVRFYSFDGTNWTPLELEFTHTTPNVLTRIGSDVDWASGNTFAYSSTGWLVPGTGTIGAVFVTDLTDVLSVEDINNLEESNIKLTPSIASTFVRLNGENVEQIKELAVYNAEGKRIAYYPNTVSEIQVSNLATGVYFVVLNLENGKQESLKFIKK